MWQITGSFERFQNVNFEASFLKNENSFKKTGVPFFSSNYYECKRNISRQNCPVKSQYLDKLNGEYEMDLSQRMDICHRLLYFFENLI